MKYKIGEVAKLLGMTTEGLRYYEDSGIVTPEKKEDSNVRYYNVWDIHMLIRARTYRRLGFSLAEVSNLINYQESIDMSNVLTIKERDIEAEITKQLNILKYVREIKNMTEDAKEMIGQFRLEYSPAIYRLEMQDRHQLLTAPPFEALICQWIEKTPYLFTSALFPKAEFESKGDCYTIGLAIEEEFADYLNVKANGQVKYFPSRLCIFTTIESSSEIQLSSMRLTNAVRYIHSQGLELVDDAFSRIVMIHKAQDIYSNLHQIWLPIE